MVSTIITHKLLQPLLSSRLIFILTVRPDLNSNCSRSESLIGYRRETRLGVAMLDVFVFCGVLEQPCESSSMEPAYAGCDYVLLLLVVLFVVVVV